QSAIRSPQFLLDLLQLSVVRRGVIRRDANLEGERLVSRRADLDAVRPAFDVQLLEDAVEVVDHADVVAIDVDLGLPRLDLQAKRSCVRERAGAVDGLRIVVAAEPRIVVSTVVAAVIPGAPEPPRIDRRAADDDAAAVIRRRNRASRDSGADDRFVAVTRPSV